MFFSPGAGTQVGTQGGTVAYVAQGVNFDGTNDYLLASGAGPLTGEVDSKKVIVSFWFRLNGGNAAYQIVFEDDGGTGKGIQIGRDNSNKWYVQGGNSSGSNVVQIITSTAYTSGGSWHHLLMSSDGAGAGPTLYIDDTSNVGFSTYDGGSNINYAVATGTRCVCNRATGSLKVNADIADLYINTAEYLDLTNSTNRRKFITAGLAPVDLGSNGSVPTGTAPLIYLHGAVASWQTNDGTGGGFTLTGTLTASSTNPP